MAKKLRGLRKTNAGAKPLRRDRATTLSIVLQGDEPPNEFRVFTAGKVETSKGTFIFDEVAAKAVMADYAAQGNELMVDYDHASLAGIALDPAQAGKAAGWFHLEVRNGELWATNVRWTEPAANQLRAKEWRYMSPAFSTDEEMRVTGLVNVALTNIPATRRLDPLMAASAREMLTMLSPESVKKALEAIKNGDAEAAMALLEEMIASAAGGEAPAEEPASAPEAAAETPPAADPEKDKPEEVAAALSSIARLSGKTSLVASVVDVELWYASHIKLESETKKLAAERATLEAAERRRLCAELVTKAGKAPAAVWANDKADAPKKYFATMSIEDFRELVADEVKANAKSANAGSPIAPASSAPGGGRDVVTKAGATVRLSQRELDMCVELNIDPVDYAATKPKKVA